MEGMFTSRFCYSLVSCCGGFGQELLSVEEERGEDAEEEEEEEEEQWMEDEILIKLSHSRQLFRGIQEDPRRLETIGNEDLIEVYNYASRKLERAQSEQQRCIQEKSNLTKAIIHNQSILRNTSPKLRLQLAAVITNLNKELRGLAQHMAERANKLEPQRTATQYMYEELQRRNLVQIPLSVNLPNPLKEEEEEEEEEDEENEE